MYIPKHFEVTDKDMIYDFIEDYSFGIIVSNQSELPVATHLPFTLNRENGTLSGHFASGNTQWGGIEGKEVLVIFHGPHHYISASWYETNQSVPTWNYVAVHVYGIIEIVEKEKDLLADLQLMTEKYEKTNEYQLDNSNNEYVEKLMKGIIGFRIHINHMEGKWKLSQNHSQERQHRVITSLEKIQSDDAQNIAKLMRQNVQDGSPKI